MALRPVLGDGLPVISFQGDERHPDRQHAVAQRLTQSVIAQIPVEQIGRFRLLPQPDQQKNISASFAAQGQLLRHRPNMPDNSRFCPRVYANGGPLLKQIAVAAVSTWNGARSSAVHHFSPELFGAWPCEKMRESIHGPG